MSAPTVQAAGCRICSCGHRAGFDERLQSRRAVPNIAADLDVVQGVAFCRAPDLQRRRRDAENVGSLLLSEQRVMRMCFGFQDATPSGPEAPRVLSYGIASSCDAANAKSESRYSQRCLDVVDRLPIS